MIQKRLKNLNVIIVTHSRTTGFPQMLYVWLLSKVKTLAFIDHPLLSSENTHSSLEIIQDGKKEKYIKVAKFSKIGVLLYIQDFFYTIFLIYTTKEKFDIAVGVDNLNTFSLIILRNLGKIKKIIYHTVDYTPNRFRNSLLNKIYHSIDVFCCYHTDMIWNSSSRMNEGRIKNGLEASKIAKTIITPDGSNLNPEKRLPINKIDRKKIVFLGHLREGMGLELLLFSFKQVLKQVVDAKLLIVGGGPLLSDLKKTVQELNISQSVEFTGFIEKHEDVDKFIRYGSIGVAPFEPLEDSIEYYSDVGKPKVYLAAGMPVVITKIPEIAFEISKKKAGIAIDYSQEELTNALVFLLKNDGEYKKYRENAINLSKKYMWENIFDEAFKKSMEYFNLI